jgi:hypothetical protein
MDQNTRAIQAPTVPGTPFEGGYYVGRLRVGTQIVALIVAPKAAGETEGTWLPDYAEAPGATSFFDGAANTAAMATAGSPIATWAQSLSINGFSDWYLPARDELELLYRNLKPTSDDNWRRCGDNPSSLPPGYPYAVQAPAQTQDEAFRAGGAEALELAWHWSSTQYSRSYAWSQHFDDGTQGINDTYDTGRARAVRRLVIE